ncbi:zinc ribbon domain-containing protein [Streptomyces sp. NPDC050263]|uniref:Zn-ribbon domain-containing OB-fold protein n=1 Tax=Streptomyces sp. NPDC050263 TaxID=3155037 RepID=UPI0034199FF8
MFHSGLGIAAGVLDSDTSEDDTTAAPRSSTVTRAGTPAEESLFFQRCRWCGTAMYHRVICPACASSDLRTEFSVGAGVVRHSTVARRGTPAARNVSLVEMGEGFTVRGRVKGPLVSVRPGCRVRLCVVEDPVRGEPVFELCDSAYGGRSR